MKLFQVYATKGSHQTQQHLGGCSINITTTLLTTNLSSKHENTITQGRVGESISDAFGLNLTYDETHNSHERDRVINSI